jgi:methionine--tRNA ligase beta chain
MEEITFDDFKKLEIRIGKIISAEKVENSDKLLKLIVEFAEGERRQVIAGIAQFYAPEALIGKECPFAYNLASRVLAGLTSQGMILCPSDAFQPAGIIAPRQGSPARSSN